MAKDAAPLKTNDTLALRHRPRKLAEVVGQDQAKKTLAGAFASKSVPNAFMFVGESGIGKTTLARLVARYLNCEKGNACGKCQSCLDMDAGSHPDYIEVNASESGNIETTRSLIESSKYLPTCNVRVFMLDEIHRASHAAVQALLVPVESPPSKTLWMFATTDPDKIPNGKALMGRCQILSLQPPTRSQVMERLMEVADEEGMDWLSEKSAETIAAASSGQVRNALQMLERVSLSIKGSDRKPGRKEIAKLVDSAWREASGDDLDDLVFRLLAALYRGKPDAAAKATLDCADPVVLLGRAASANANCMGLSLMGKHERLWNNRPSVALSKALGKDMPSPRKMSETTLELLAAREGLFTVGQQFPHQYAMSRMVALCGKEKGK